MRLKNLVGSKYGRLTVISMNEKRVNKKIIYTCKCDCGKQVDVIGESLPSGNSTSCGCRKSEIVSMTHTKHGKCRTPEFKVWKTLRQRCLNKNNQKYKDYGGRGIQVCKRWDKFENFIEDMGPRTSQLHSIDRINNDGNYEPGNCRWATSAEQAKNKRNTIKL